MSAHLFACLLPEFFNTNEMSFCAKLNTTLHKCQDCSIALVDDVAFTPKGSSYIKSQSLYLYNYIFHSTLLLLKLLPKEHTRNNLDYT
jgi:hypothetical protein